MVKSRRYGDHGAEAAGSANASLLCALSVLNRLFAPYLPFVTEEVWSWWQPGSVHAARWPTVEEIERVAARDEDARLALETSIDVLREIRRIKSTSKKPAKTRIRVARIHADPKDLPSLGRLDVDLRSAAAADRLEFFEKTAPLLVELEFDENPPGGDARE
jgi:valyl-tRNA synthetase